MMAVEIPTVGVVPQCDAPLARCSTIETPRISQEGSLNWRTIRDAFAPQTLTSFDAGNHRWSAVQTLASYNRSGFHVLFIDRTDRYVPDATFMEDKEGEKLMKVLAFTGQYQQGLDNTHAIHIGYNWSPASFGEKGLQSVPTKHHPQCWNEEADLPYVSIEDIKSDVQPALLGTPYHREFGAAIGRILEAIDYPGIDHQNAWSDNQGIIVPLQADLPTLFETPGFFGEFYQPLNEGLKRMAFELSGAMTTADHEGIIKELKEDYASGKTVEAYEELKKPHALRPESQRKARLESLGENVPAEAVTLFLALSDSPEVARLRKGLGFAVDFAQEVDTGAANLRIMPAIFDESFGVVEARRIGLNRILKVPETPQEIADLHSKNGIHRKFAEALAGTVNSL